MVGFKPDVFLQLAGENNDKYKDDRCSGMGLSV
jgi:hypothetical protein